MYKRGCRAVLILFGPWWKKQQQTLLPSCLQYVHYLCSLLISPCIPTNHSKERKGHQNLLLLADSSQARHSPTRATQNTSLSDTRWTCAKGCHLSRPGGTLPVCGRAPVWDPPSSLPTRCGVCGDSLQNMPMSEDELCKRQEGWSGQLLFVLALLLFSLPWESHLSSHFGDSLYSQA